MFCDFKSSFFTNKCSIPCNLTGVTEWKPLGLKQLKLLQLFCSEKNFRVLSLFLSNFNTWYIHKYKWLLLLRQELVPGVSNLSDIITFKSYSLIWIGKKYVKTYMKSEDVFIVMLNFRVRRSSLPEPYAFWQDDITGGSLLPRYITRTTTSTESFSLHQK